MPLYNTNRLIEVGITSRETPHFSCSELLISGECLFFLRVLIRVCFLCCYVYAEDQTEIKL